MSDLVETLRQGSYITMLRNYARFTLRAVTLVVLLCLILTGFQPVCADNIARYGADFLIDAGGASSLGMGGVKVALPGNAWSLFWNPAAMHELDHVEAGLMHSERFAGVVDYDAAAAILPVDENNVYGAGFVRLGVTGIPFTKLENPGEPLGNQNRIEIDKVVTSGDYAFFVGKSGIYKNWMWGVTPKLIFRHIGSKHQGYGLGIDAGIKGKPIQQFPLYTGLVARDILGTPLVWDTGDKEIIVPSVSFGFSVPFSINALEADILPAADVEYRFESAGYEEAFRYNAGLEYLVRKIVALRVGYNDDRLTLGGGLHIKSVSVNYAYLGHDELGDTHRISISSRWNKWF